MFTKPILKFTYFWKILLLIWLILALLLTANLFFSQINSDNVRFRSLPPHLKSTIHKNILQLEKVLNRQKLNRPSNSIKLNRFKKRIYVLDDDGKDLFGKPVSEILNELDQLSKKNRVMMTALRKRTLFYGGMLFQYNGRQYRIFAKEKVPVLSSGYFGFFLRDFAHRLLLTTFFVSFPLSFLLAWFFTRPIKKLQDAIKDISKDINHREELDKLKKRSDEFGDLAKDFDSMASHLSEILLSKSRLIGDVSHELKSPLARLQISLGLIRKKYQNIDSNELQRIKSEADKMDEMISLMLQHSRMENVTIESKLITFQLLPLVRLLTDDLEFENQSNTIQIELLIDSDLIIKADKSLLLSCIENVLRNAMRYAESAIIIKAEKDEINNQTIISISDDGPGVPESELDKIFDAFYRPDLSRTRKSGGVGLGLSIVKTAVEAQNGHVKAKLSDPRGLIISMVFSN